jgi:hypothetical protein
VIPSWMSVAEWGAQVLICKSSGRDSMEQQDIIREYWNECELVFFQYELRLYEITGVKK